MRPFRTADRFAVQILDLLDSRLAVHVEGRKAKKPRADNGQTDKVAVFAGDLGRELGKGHLGQVKFAVECHACEAFMMAEQKPVEVDTLCLNDAGANVAKVVVVRGGDRQRKFRHRNASSTRP